MRALWLVGMVACCAAFVLPAEPDEGLNGAELNGAGAELTLTLRADRHVYRVGEHIVVSMQVENTSQTVVCIPEDTRRFVLSLEDLSGASAFSGAIVAHPPPPLGSRWIVLYPGDYYGNTRTILFPPARPGVYKMYVTYYSLSSDTQHPAPDVCGVKVLGKRISAVTEIDVRKAVQ